MEITEYAAEDSIMFQWDNGNLAHLANHSVSAKEAEQVTLNDPLDVDIQIRSGEERTLQLGATDAGRVLFVVATTRGTLIRIITAFPADRKSRRFYAQQKKDRHSTAVKHAVIPE